MRLFATLLPFFADCLNRQRHWVAWLLWLLLSLGLSWRTAGQQLPSTAPWVADSVLSTLTVRALATDELGYLWVATTEGVRRYDGYQAVPLAQLITSAKVAAPGSYIHALVRAEGRLWIGGAEGLYYWEVRTGTLTRHPLPLPVGSANGTETELVYALWLDPRTHLLWVGYSSGRVLVLDPAHPAGHYALPRSLGGEPHQFTAAPGGAVWLTTRNGQLHWLDSQGRRRRQYRHRGAYLLPVPGTRQFVSSQALYELDATADTLREQQRWLPATTSENDYFQPTLDAQGRPVQWLGQQRHLVVQWGAPGQKPLVKQLSVAFDATEPSTQYTLFPRKGQRSK
jgi:hypothetical protein